MTEPVKPEAREVQTTAYVVGCADCDMGTYLTWTPDEAVAVAREMGMRWDSIAKRWTCRSCRARTED